MPMTQRQMVKLLHCHGWKKVIGGKGSHIKMSKVGHRPITVPHGELNRITQDAIFKEANLII